MRHYLLDNNSNNLLIFFCGWGMDATPFLMQKFSSDVLFLYDYQDMDIDFDFDVYENIQLLAFSYGVYAAGMAEKLLPKLNKKIAINGTLIPIDDEFGVPFKKFALTENMNSETIVKFRERLFYKKEELELFNQNLPERSAESCTNELVKIKNIFKSTAAIPQMKFDKVYIGIYDKVVPAKNQMNFWQKYSDSTIIKIENGHFPFYSYKNVEKLT